MTLRTTIALLCGCGVSCLRTDVVPVATSYDMDAKTPTAAIGHWDLSQTASKMLVDLPFQDWDLTLGSAMLSPYEYATFVDSGEGGRIVTVHDLENGTSAKSCDVNVGLEAVRCQSMPTASTAVACCAVDINTFSVMTVDPRTCKLGHVLTFDPLLYSGVDLTTSALDPVNGVYYLTLTSTRTSEPHIMAADLHRKTISRVPPPFGLSANSGPLCFDPLLGLLSLGHPAGGVVALNPNGSLAVLRQEGLGGIPVGGVACMRGVLVVDFYKPLSPSILVAVDFTSSVRAGAGEGVSGGGGGGGGGVVFHNSTVEPKFHSLQLAYRGGGGLHGAAAASGGSSRAGAVANRWGTAVTAKCDTDSCCCPGDPTGEACCGAGLACVGSGLGACGCGRAPPPPCVADFGAKPGDKRKCGVGVVASANQTCTKYNPFCDCDVHSPCAAPAGTGSCLSSPSGLPEA